MTRSKLTDSDRQTIVNLFQGEDASIASLAERYKVSTSTIRRVIKEALEPGDIPAAEDAAIAESPIPSVADIRELSAAPAAPLLIRRRTRRTGKTMDSDDQPAAITDFRPEAMVSPSTLEVLAESRPPAIVPPIPALELDPDYNDAPPEQVLAAFLGEEMEDDLDNELEDLEDEDLEDEDLEDEEELEGAEAIDAAAQLHIRSETLVHIVPLAEAMIPRICYLVIDRYAELITRPLREFGDLGQIPPEEIQARTLPVFDNHRVAKRFSNPRFQRVVKVPDGRMLQKACSQLHAKGITRLLINGQVYSL